MYYTSFNGTGVSGALWATRVLDECYCMHAACVSLASLACPSFPSPRFVQATGNVDEEVNSAFMRMTLSAIPNKSSLLW